MLNNFSLKINTHRNFTCAVRIGAYLSPRCLLRIKGHGSRENHGYSSLLCFYHLSVRPNISYIIASLGAYVVN